MYKEEIKTNYNFNVFSLVPLLLERFRRLAKYGKLHNKIYGN